MLIAIFTWQIVGDYFLNIVSLWELNGLKLGKKQYIVAIYQTDIRYISVQVWNWNLYAFPAEGGIRLLNVARPCIM